MDGLCTRICISCTEKLLSLHSFRAMYIASDAKLRKRYLETIKDHKDLHRFNKSSNCDGLKQQYIVEKCKLEFVATDITGEECQTNNREDSLLESSSESTCNFSHVIEEMDDEDKQVAEGACVNELEVQNSVDKSKSQCTAVISPNQSTPSPADMDSTASRTCGICKKNFPSAQSRHIHEYVHKQGHFECVICARVLTSPGFLRVHMQNTHNIFIPKISTSRDGSSTPSNKFDCLCDICNKYFTLGQIVRHMRVHAGKHSRPKCSQCPLTFSCTKNLRRHINNIHFNQTKGEPRFLCNQCPQTFHRAIELYEHGKSHDQVCNETEEGFDLRCDDCKFWKADSLESFAKHMMQVHDQTRVQPYKCRLCNARNGSKTGMYMHITCHHGSKVGAPGESETGLKPPKSGNLKDKPFSCTLCDFRFKSARRLEEHTRVHTGE